MLYRLYTEDINRREVEVLVAKYFEGFTITPATGYWQLKREQTIIIDIVGEEGNLIDCFQDIKRLCEEIKKLNKQESILILSIPTTASFL